MSRELASRGRINQSCFGYQTVSETVFSLFKIRTERRKVDNGTSSVLEKRMTTNCRNRRNSVLRSEAILQNSRWTEVESSFLPPVSQLVHRRYTLTRKVDYPSPLSPLSRCTSYRIAALHIAGSRPLVIPVDQGNKRSWGEGENNTIMYHTTLYCGTVRFSSVLSRLIHCRVGHLCCIGTGLM